MNRRGQSVVELRLGLEGCRGRESDAAIEAGSGTALLEEQHERLSDLREYPMCLV